MSTELTHLQKKFKEFEDCSNPEEDQLAFLISEALKVDEKQKLKVNLPKAGIIYDNGW